MKYDVSVIGAGPAGSVAAERASRENDVVLVGSEHRVQCAGVISISGLTQLGVKPDGWVLNKVRGAKLVSPLGFEAVIDGGEHKAYVVDRLAFDRKLVDDAVNSGVNYIPSVVDGVNGSLLHTSGGDRLKSDKIVLATGTDYALQKRLGLDYPKDFLVGVQYEMEVECDSDFVELHFIVPDFFAWVIPVDGYARVGLCSKRNAKSQLDKFVSRLGRDGRLRSDRKLSEVYGIVPVHDPLVRTQYDKIVTVGDAAGHVKASSGGGVVFGCLAAELACSENYESEWRRRIGGELKLHLMLHNSLVRLKPENMDRLLRLVSAHHSDLERGGDMDYAGKTLRNLLVKPMLALDFLINTPHFLRDLISFY